MSFSVPARRGACAISFCTLDGINVAAAATDATCAAFVSNRRRVNTGALDIDELLTFPVLRFSRRDRRRQDCTSRSEEHTSELQSLMRTSYAVFCSKNKRKRAEPTSRLQSSMHHSSATHIYTQQ